MSLAESASSRKERLEALRKRKAGQGAQDGSVLLSLPSSLCSVLDVRKTKTDATRCF
jgi:hypothetical protein